MAPGVWPSGIPERERRPTTVPQGWEQATSARANRRRDRSPTKVAAQVPSAPRPRSQHSSGRAPTEDVRRGAQASGGAGGLPSLSVSGRGFWPKLATSSPSRLARTLGARSDTCGHRQGGSARRRGPNSCNLSPPDRASPRATPPPPTAVVDTANFEASYRSSTWSSAPSSPGACPPEAGGPNCGVSPQPAYRAALARDAPQRARTTSGKRVGPAAHARAGSSLGSPARSPAVSIYSEAGAAYASRFGGATQTSPSSGAFGRSLPFTVPRGNDGVSFCLRGGSIGQLC